jgi:hypothetical protein
MRLFKTIGLLILIFFTTGIQAEAQPIPIELMMGLKYGSVVNTDCASPIREVLKVFS